MPRRRFVFTLAVIVFVGLLTLLICLPPAYAHQAVELELEGRLVETDPTPFIASNRVMVPVPFLAVRTN